MTLKSDTVITDTLYEFDVYIKSDSGTIDLTSYQIILSFNTDIVNGGNLSFTYINGSSQLSNVPVIEGIENDVGNQNLAAGSGHGNDTISTANVRIGKFRLSNTKSFGDSLANIKWDFDNLIKTEVNINDSNVTDSSNHVNILKNPPLHTVTGIVENNLPRLFELYQNYPNPFNPTTKIKFSLPSPGDVNLVIYNVVGQKIITLINSYVGEGEHTANFNGTNFASGTYIYVLRFNNTLKVRKMILLK